MAVVAIIPAHNEAANIGEVVRRAIRHVDTVVVIDDGSKDETAMSAVRAGAGVLKLPVNLGYGAALQTGYLYAARRDCRALVQLDADGQHDPEQIPEILEPVLSGECDLALGSRFLGKGEWRGPLLRRLGSRFFSILVKIASGKVITDPTSGFQAMNREVIERLAGGVYPDDFPDADVIVMLLREKFRVKEVGVVMRPSPTGKSMHSGLKPVYYVAKMLLSIFVVMLRKRERALS
jgi:glycosyltransferase involved in cell wall biosynthesis